jgi:hypothetical protein
MASGAGIAIEDTIVLTELLQSDDPLPDVLEKLWLGGTNAVAWLLRAHTNWRHGERVRV